MTGTVTARPAARGAPIRIRVEEATAGSPAECYLAAHPEGTPFQTGAWSRAVSDSYGIEGFDLTASGPDGGVRGAVRLHLLRDRWFPTTLASSPYGSYGGLCADDPAAATMLASAAIRLCLRVGADRLEMKNVAALDHPALVGHADFAEYRLEMADPDTLWRETFRSALRRDIRRAREGDLQVVRGPHLLDAFFDIMSVSMRRLGTPIHSRRFYRSILEHFGERADLMAVLHRNRPVSVHLLLHSDEASWSLYQGSLAESWSLHPNHLLYWEALRLAWSRGARRFEFGRSLVGSGHARFKESFGAEPVPLHYAYHLPAGGPPPRLHQGNRRYRMAREVWRRLPLPVTRRLGPPLIRCVP